MPESTTEPLTGQRRFFRPDQHTPTGDSTRKANPGLTARRALHKDLMHALDRVVRHVNRLGLEDEEKMLVEWAITYRTLDQRLAAATVKFEQQLDLEVPCVPVGVSVSDLADVPQRMVTPITFRNQR
ncbi:hypothetical protein BS297_17670 [Rhodococcus erythropolis]|uniref:Uncharacterized protein n=1 Tax=Rhodococcus erythropolis TaxID=1833 RepID=A0A0C2ZYM1_RHOER|nr:hypothetical protein BS297_17670 [Rhodococcus erythropolis]KIM17550.1 hypothetical protein QV65_04180 [Rhodococcus erythropolis]